MFHLTKILNGRTGVPEPARISLTTAATVNYGTPVSIRGGTVTAMSAASTALPTHLILKDASASREVLAAPITDAMIFEVPLSAAPTSMTVGTEYQLSADGASLSATAVASGKRGATLVDKMGAVAAGDKVLVAFKN